MHSLVTAPTLIEQVELARIHAAGQLNPARRAELGQFFTPAPLAQLMGALLPGSQRHVSLLDAGAGVGSLLSAGVEALANAPEPPQAIEVTAYEIDPALLPYLRQTLQRCQELCEARQIAFCSRVIEQDFIAHAVERIGMPVSYTHLDVYKRQTQFLAAL